VEYLVTPEVYDSLYLEEQYTKYKCLLDVVKELRGLVLDAGCGTGLLYEFLKSRELASQLKYVCVDPSREMLTRAKSRVDSPLVLLLEGYAEELPFRSSVFDYVFSISTWGAISEKLKALRELKRITKRGGLLVISGHPRTFTIRPPDLDSEFTELLECIDYFYIAVNT